MEHLKGVCYGAPEFISSIGSATEILRDTVDLLDAATSLPSPSARKSFPRFPDTNSSERYQLAISLTELLEVLLFDNKKNHRALACGPPAVGGSGGEGRDGRDGPGRDGPGRDGREDGRGERREGETFSVLMDVLADSETHVTSISGLMLLDKLCSVMSNLVSLHGGFREEMLSEDGEGPATLDVLMQLLASPSDDLRGLLQDGDRDGDGDGGDGGEGGDYEGLYTSLVINACNLVNHCAGEEVPSQEKLREVRQTRGGGAGERRERLEREREPGEIMGRREHEKKQQRDEREGKKRGGERTERAHR